MRTYVFDTNVVVRYFLRDNEVQYTQAAKIIKNIEDNKAKGKLSVLVVGELVWVFQSVYKMKRKDFIPQILDLIVFKNISIVEVNKEIVINVLKRMLDKTYDFVDIYLYEIANKREIFSFDKDLAKVVKNK